MHKPHLEGCYPRPATMKVAIHQPQFLPYPGFFHKVSLADVLVVMDDVQYDRRFTNRNRILGPHGPMWLTVPINKSNKFGRNMDVEINNSLPWRTEHWKRISHSYRNAKWFESYGPYFEEVYSKEYHRLINLDLELMWKVFDWLGIEVPIIMESDLKVEGEGTRRLVNVCEAVGAGCYVSGKGGRGYLDETLFAQRGIELQYQVYEPRPYGQRFSSSFVPDLSIVDMLFNLGPQASDFLGSAGVVLETPSAG